MPSLPLSSGPQLGEREIERETGKQADRQAGRRRQRLFEIFSRHVSEATLVAPYDGKKGTCPLQVPFSMASVPPPLCGHVVYRVEAYDNTERERERERERARLAGLRFGDHDFFATKFLLCLPPLSLINSPVTASFSIDTFYYAFIATARSGYYSGTLQSLAEPCPMQGRIMDIGHTFAFSRNASFPLEPPCLHDYFSADWF